MCALEVLSKLAPLPRWLPSVRSAAQAEAQGETFYPLAIEAGGTLNARFHEFL